MSTEKTVQMLDVFRQQVDTPRFLSSFFQSPARNFHNSEDVEVDILREDEEVAVTVADITSSARMNEATRLTNKRFTPPVFKEAGPINAYRLMLRVAGQNPYQDPQYQANAMAAAMDIGRKTEGKIRRAVELMASQVLQTGALTMKGDDGATRFTMDFSPKTSHFPTAGTSWATSATCTPLDDIESLADTIRTNARKECEDAIFGRVAIQNFLASTQVQTIADNRRFSLVYIEGVADRGGGAKYHGTIVAGQYRLNLWSYTGRYKDVETGTITKYVDDNNVILRAPGRLDLTWGNIPQVGPMDQRLLPYLPSRVASSGNGIDLHYNAWRELDGTGVTVQVAARPLTVPTEIDSFGCLDTIP